MSTTDSVHSLSPHAVTALVTEVPPEGEKKGEKSGKLGSFRRKLSRSKSKPEKDLVDAEAVSELGKALLKIEAQDEAIKTLKGELLDACTKNKNVFVDLEESVKKGESISAENDKLQACVKAAEDERIVLKQELSASEERLQQESKKNNSLQSLADSNAAELEKTREEIQTLMLENEQFKKEIDDLRMSHGRAKSPFHWFGKSPKTKEATTSEIKPDSSPRRKFITQSSWQLRFYGVVY